MYLLYVDESGEPTNKDEEYFVLGAVAVYENNAYFLSEAIDKIQDKRFPGATQPIEFHAAKIFNHSEEPWRSMPKEDRKGVIYDLCLALDSINQKGLSLFGVAIHKWNVSIEMGQIVS